MKFNEKSQKRIDEVLQRYPNKQAALLPLLWVAQEEFGWISPEAMELVAKTLDISPAHVYGVVTFYTMYHQKPVGRHHLQVCRTLSCAMMGADKILCHLKDRLRISEGETTPDGRFTLSTVECLASCGTAPAVQVNRTYHESLTTEKVDQLLETLK
jgi:NADH-quinone oxidoreductase subunit E